ncbi:DUF1801 domain-containing protein [Pseudoalteromonas sp. C2R02]|uniref:DUF1801 domain-containing protein n=1 Tax=Pseudoalteromonas sp. C2R02 TaxID=2841565 RepID=UPI001C08BA33|nr:DUF1801 domain-containing protein [Pseudoalteromonas sp. C2R02]MBU2970219.1 DUF1801 domain-containing protein [Pseudoalteromonas sp. C2R02]
MNEMVKSKFDTYPEDIKTKLLLVRALIFELANELGLGQVTESLKWGEPSYHVKNGSPIRIDWKQKNPEHYAIYFNCKTKLVDTFKVLYTDELTFEDNRAIIFKRTASLPTTQVKHCLSLSLKYHKVKNLVLLGV